MTEPAPFSLIIPAHNEEAVIARCLTTVLNDAPTDYPFEVIVAANGCTDNTVEVASLVSPTIKVLDIAEGSKTNAINLGMSEARYFPRIVLDADVECTHSSLAALAEALQQPGAMTAAPAIRLNLDRCSWLIKSYYAAWIKQPYAKSGKGGAGCYGLSREALEIAGPFPKIIGDDIWIHTRFPDEQKRLVTEGLDGQPVFSVVRPPRTAWQQIKVEARRQLGNAEVRRDYPSPHFAALGQGGGWRKAIRSGASPIHLAAFYGMKVFARIEARLSQWRGQGSTWTRDLTSREL